MSDLADADVLTLAEAARLIRVSEKTLGDMARMRRIPCQKVGREWRFLRDALKTWLSGGDRPAPAPYFVKEAEAAAQYELPLSGFRDTAFTENRNQALHRWVPWIAGFSGSFVEGVLNEFGGKRRRLRVLDPFAGVGTTLIEALRRGHEAVGFEINPYAALACRAKARAGDYDLDQFQTAIGRFDDFADEKLWLDQAPALVSPPGFKSRVPFFSPSIEKQVLACLDFVYHDTADWVKELFQIAFGAVMVSFSNYSYEPSLGTRAGAGKPNVEHADVVAVIKRKLNDMAEDIASFQQELSQHRDLPAAVVHPLSYLEHSDRIEPRSIDVLITSPPYLNNYHYIRNTRPHLFWLGMVQETADLKDIECKSFGQFWQTVRSGPDVSLQPDLPHLAGLIDELRGRNREKGAYGGPGWANYAATYFNDCHRFCALTREHLRTGGTVVAVIGNNILQGIEFKTDRLFADIAESEGFHCVGFHEVRSKRTGNSIVNSSVRSGTVTQRARLYETAVELRAT